MSDYGPDNNGFTNEEQIQRENIEREAERYSRQDNQTSQGVSIRIGSGEGGDLWHSKAYQAKLEGEVSAVTDILNEIAGPEVFEKIRTKTESGMTRSEAVKESAEEYLENIYSEQIDLDKAADAVVDAMGENGIQLEDVAAIGIEAFKELVTEVAKTDLPDNSTNETIIHKLDALESAVEKLGDKIEQVHSEADAMNDKRDDLAKVDTKQRVRLAMERDLCELIEKSEDSGLNDEALVEEKTVLYKHPTICISCGRFLAQSTHFRTMVFSNKGKRSTIEMCSQCVRYIRKHKLNYDRNGLKGILTEKAG